MEVGNNNNSPMSNSPTSRPVIPPKPKGSPSHKSTVGIQVNLRRKTSPSIRCNENTSTGPTNASSSPSNNSYNNGQLRQSELSPDQNKSSRVTIKSGLSKPALPPKPVTGLVTPPKKSFSAPPGKNPPSLSEKTSRFAQTNLSSKRSSEEPSFSLKFKSCTNNDITSTTIQLSNSSKSVSRKSSALPSSKVPTFQFPLTSFVSPARKFEVTKKSTSLGRNFDVAAFTKELKKSNNSMARVTPLDLSSCTNKPASLPPSFGKAITFAPLNRTQPPAPPPRRKRSCISSPAFSPTTSSLASSTPKPIPVYAKVDMGRKWEMRRLKEYQPISSQEPEKRSLTAADESHTPSQSTFLNTVEEGLPNNSWLSNYLPSKETETESDVVITEDFSPITKVNHEALAGLTAEKPLRAAVETRANAKDTLSENDSFLFHHIEQETSEEAVADNNGIELSENEITTKKNSSEKIGNTDEHQNADSFENDFEQKLETLPVNSVSELYKIHNKNVSNNFVHVHVEETLENPSEILETVTVKIQNLPSFLSDVDADDKMEGSQTANPTEVGDDDANDGELVSQIVYHKFDKASSVKKSDTFPSCEVNNSAAELQPQSDVSDCRRMSWNCSESSSYSSETPSSSSSSIRGVTTTSWVDEGEISTGALGDVDSDAPIATSGGPSHSNVHGAISRRRRIASLFSSFGKGSGSSSSNNGNGETRHTPRRSVKPCFSSQPTFRSPIDQQKIMSDAGINQGKPLQGSSQFFSPLPQKTQSLPGFGLSGDGQTVPHSITSPSSTIPSSTFETVSGSSVTFDEKDETESVTSSCSLFEEILADLTPKEKKIFQVAREILTSERTFVGVLNLLTVDFPNALKQASIHPLVSDYDLNVILGGLPQLKHVNEILLSDLEERICGWKTNPKVSDIFVKKGPFLKHYSTYIRDFKSVCEYFDETRKKYPKFDKTVNEFECGDRCQKLGLKHYMLKPVQRMPQYSLLLEQYLQKLDESCEDYEDTVKAITIVRDVAEHANEAIRLKENGDQIKRLQERLVHNNEILKADRQITKEGSLEKVCRKGNQPRYFALMTDCLMCMMYNTTAGLSKDLKLRYELPLAGMKVHSIPSEDRLYEFSVISTTRSFNLVARSEKERECWVRELNTAIYDNIKKRACSTPDMEKEFEMGKVLGSKAPVWIQDTRVTMCQACTAEFTITFRRHHCRACGKVVCGNCSGNEAPLQYLKFETARVCDDCYQTLLGEFDKEQIKNSEDLEKIKSMEEVLVRFKKTTPNVSKYRHKKSIPQRLEVNSANTSQISGYLHWREKKSWKRRWFVLSNNVLYVCMAPEDVVAYKTIPILGYDVEMISDKTYEGVDGKLVFRLTHSGQDPMFFQADTISAAERWVTLMKDATVLSKN